MYTGLIASRYASALAEFSAANGNEERTYDEVRRLIGLYRRDRSLRDVLFSPVVGDEAKLEVLRGAFGRPMSASLEGFVCGWCCAIAGEPSSPSCSIFRSRTSTGGGATSARRCS